MSFLYTWLNRRVNWTILGALISFSLDIHLQLISSSGSMSLNSGMSMSVSWPLKQYKTIIKLNNCRRIGEDVDCTYSNVVRVHFEYIKDNIVKGLVGVVGWIVAVVAGGRLTRGSGGAARMVGGGTLQIGKLQIGIVHLVVVVVQYKSRCLLLLWLLRRGDVELRLLAGLVGVC